MKLQQISDISPIIPFTEFDILQKYRESFKISELGRIRSRLPIKELARALSSHLPKKHPQGKKPMFSPKGEVALMFLKSYLATSDDGLVEMLNANIHMQIFCSQLTKRNAAIVLRHPHGQYRHPRRPPNAQRRNRETKEAAAKATSITPAT